MVKRALDSGAHGIIVPLVNTAEEAQKIVHAAKFPPLGGRGFGSPFSMEKFGIQSAGEYLQQSNDALVTIVQIETGEALQNVDLIAKVSGVDVIFIGPFDLGNSIGHPITDGIMAVELKDAIATILQTAKDNGKHTGIYATSGEQAREFADQGFQMISVVADMIAIPNFLSASLAKAKGGYGHAALNLAKGAVSGAAKMTGPYGR